MDNIKFHELNNEFIGFSLRYPGSSNILRTLEQTSSNPSHILEGKVTLSHKSSHPLVCLRLIHLFLIDSQKLIN